MCNNFNSFHVCNLTINDIIYVGGEHVMYELSGTATDGFFKLYSSSKQGITLNGGYVCGHSAGNDGLDANAEGTILKSYTKETGFRAQYVVKITGYTQAVHQVMQ